MTPQPVPTSHAATKPSWMRRVLSAALMTVYVAALFFGLDYLYTQFIYEKDVSGRYANDHYHHGIKANFDAYETWGRTRERLISNNLGFKDFKIRDVPATSDTRRVLLIGDSFTEGVGLKFEDTFAGMLYFAGQERTEKIEFLNAAVISYSPTIYYRKIKYLIEAGLKFDEVIVFSDLSDVHDEAISYFCFDEHPEFLKYCSAPLTGPLPKPTLTPVSSRLYVPNPPIKLKDQLAITDRLVQIFRHYLDLYTGGGLRFVDRLHVTQRGGWTMRAIDVEKAYAPLGVEGGIRRSLMNMEALATLLSEHNIALSVAVYPWPFQLIYNDRNSRQIELWRDFCAKQGCKRFIDLFPAMFAERDARSDWYERNFIPGDIHYSAEGNRLLFRALAKELL
jgi:hypothetical protein